MPIPLFQFLRNLDPELDPEACKVHLAVHNGEDDPLDVYVAGGFDRWQAWQTAANFNRDRVVSLIALPGRDAWLFAGTYRVADVERLADRHYEYALDPNPLTAPLNGRVVVRFTRSGRQSYLLAEKWAEQMTIAELRPLRMRIAEFPGYARALLTWRQLAIVVEQRVPSWRAALVNVAGVYVITDRKTGKLYVGSASGDEGLWGRWCSYANLRHGHNAELIELLRIEGEDHAEHFQFGILEIADTHASRDDMLERESHWKRLLATREHGYNAN